MSWMEDPTMSKEEARGEEPEGANAVAGDGRGEPEEGGGGPRRKRRIVAAAVAAAAAAAVCVAGIAAAVAPSEAPAPEKGSPAEEQAQGEGEPESDRRYSLAVNVEADGWTDAATKATVRLEATAPHGEVEPVEREVECNEAVMLVEAGELVAGATYKVSVVAAPVLEDGSTYTAGDPLELRVPSRDGAANTVEGIECEERDDAAVALETVSADESRIVVGLRLAPKALEDMTAEEAEASAGALEAPGNSAAAQSAAQNPPSVSGGGSDYAPPASGSGGGGGAPSAGGASGGGGESTGGGTPPPVDDRYEGNPKYGYWESVEKWVCNTCGAEFSSLAALEAHQKASQDAWLNTPPDQPLPSVCGGYSYYSTPVWVWY